MYGGSSPEPDSLAMVSGMTMTIRGDVPLRDALIYGREASPGMYLVGCFVFPLLFRDPSDLLPFLDWMTVIASAAAAWPLFRLARLFLTPMLASAIATVGLLAPTVWEASTYFHPEVIAATMLLLAIATAVGEPGLKPSVRRTAVAVALGAVSILVRTHVLFVWPGLFLGALLAKQRRHYLTVLATTTACGLGMFAIFQAAFPQLGDSGAGGTVRFVQMIANVYFHAFSLNGMLRSLVWAGFGIGVATCVLALGELLSPTRRRTMVSWRSTLVGITWSLPFFIYWLPQPLPILRHYVLPSFGILLVLAAFMSRLPARTAPWVAVAVAVLNFSVPEIAYRVYNSRNGEAPKTPHGAIVYQHSVMQERIRRFEEAGRALSADLNTDTSNGVIVFTQWESYTHILYYLTQNFDDIRPLATTSFFPGVQRRDYTLLGRTVSMINYVYFEDPELQRRGLKVIRDGISNGYTVFLPKELAEGSFAAALSGVNVTTF